MEKKYTNLKPEEVDYVLVKTTSGGPFVEDVFFLILSKATNGFWQIPHSSDKYFLDWLKQFPNVNMEQFIKSMGCSEDRIFILYRGPNFPVLSEQKKESLKIRLVSLLTQNFEGGSEDLVKIAEKVYEKYSESSRHYHNLEHIQNCLWELDQVSVDGIDKTSIELAIWYHDLVYSPLSNTNELESANRLKEDLGLLVSRVNLEEVHRMILCTPSTVKARILTESEKYFLDIDYSVLGQRELEYMAYKQNVRLEYHSVPSLLYHLKRKAFLKSILKREIYQTNWFKERFETQALKNINKELSNMPYKLLPTLSWKVG